MGDRDVTALKPHQLGRLGLAFVPENRRIFPNLTVEENLKIATVMAASGPWSLRAHLSAVSSAFRSVRRKAAIRCPAASSRCWRSAAAC